MLSQQFSYVKTGQTSLTGGKGRSSFSILSIKNVSICKNDELNNGLRLNNTYFASLWFYESFLCVFSSVDSELLVMINFQVRRSEPRALDRQTVVRPVQTGFSLFEHLVEVMSVIDLYETCFIYKKYIKNI